MFDCINGPSVIKYRKFGSWSDTEIPANESQPTVDTESKSKHGLIWMYTGIIWKTMRVVLPVKVELPLGVVVMHGKVAITLGAIISCSSSSSG